MNEDIKRQWISALRSGEYEQGRGFLNRGGKYCCLGVLCDLAAGDGIIPEPVEYHEGSSAMTYDGEARVLPASVMLWAGMLTAYGNLKGQILTLSEMNDFGMSFARIADIIEESA